MANEDEGGIDSENNVFASLMPNLFNRLRQCNDTVSEQEFQEIDRLLTQAGSDGGLMKGNSSSNQPLTSSSKQSEKASDLTNIELKSKPSHLTRFDYASGKENSLPTKLPLRNKLSRRERSSRVTTHRKPFVVDVRNFGSLLSNNELGKCKKPQDVLAFWEAADEREASEAIMRKLRGINEPKPGNKDIASRRVGVRRKNSKRTTTRLKCFSVELPACADQVQSLDEEQLEEEEDATESSSFTFLSNPEYRAQNQFSELSNAEKRTDALQLLSSVKSANKDVIDLDGEAEAESRSQEEDNNNILSGGKSPFENFKSTNQSSIGLADIAAFRNGTDEGEKRSQPPETSTDGPILLAVEPMNSSAVDSQIKELEEDLDSANEFGMEVTPCNRNVAAKRTPLTSPTPPSNPLAELGLRKENVVEDVSKRRLDFEVDSTASTPSHLDLSAPITQITPSLKDSLESPKNPKAQAEVIPPANVVLAHEEEANGVKADLVPTMATKGPEQNEVKPLKKAISKRKKLIKNQRHSLSGVGTKWKEGQRCSTRIRSRPLEWWRGERFLMGRVHKSLATVIGIKYSSPPPCWPKRGTKAPEFKVESYVSEEYAKYVHFAALC